MFERIDAKLLDMFVNIWLEAVTSLLGLIFYEELCKQFFFIALALFLADRPFQLLTQSFSLHVAALYLNFMVQNTKLLNVKMSHLHATQSSL